MPILSVLAAGMCPSNLIAQERDNLLRSLSPSVPASQSDKPTLSQKLEADKAKDAGKAKDPGKLKDSGVTIKAIEISKNVDSSKQNESSTFPSSGSKATQSRKPKDSISLPPLTIPNTEVDGIGTGARPEDLVSGRLPPTIQLPFGDERYGLWQLGTKTWAASVYCHQPTYFEDTMLENHGHERWGYAQPLVSGVRFYTAAFKLPYFSYLDPPLRFTPSSDHFRPGSPSTPCVRQRGYYDAGALRFQILTTGVGLVAGQP